MEGRNGRTGGWPVKGTVGICTQIMGMGSDRGMRV